MAYRNRRSDGDPYWLQTRYSGVCAKCMQWIKQGERAYYYPNVRLLFCYREDCGPAHERDFRACAADERAYSGGY